MFILFLFFLSIWSWQYSCVKWFFVQSREKQAHAYDAMVCHSVSSVQTRPRSDASRHDISFFSYHKDAIFWHSPFLSYTLFSPILLRQRCKNTHRTKEKRTSYSFYFMSSMFFCCVLYIYLGSLLVTYIDIQTHTHTRARKKINLEFYMKSSIWIKVSLDRHVHIEWPFNYIANLERFFLIFQIFFFLFI
jgi:hypothetical protein